MTRLTAVLLTFVVVGAVEIPRTVRKVREDRARWAHIQAAEARHRDEQEEDQ